MTTETWGERAAWIYFALSSGSVLPIAVTAFRRRERWAWLAFWYWPVLFATHFVTYESGFRYAQLVWLTLSVAALLATRRKVWDRPSAAAAARPRAPA
jgi:hypothetical protein